MPLLEICLCLRVIRIFLLTNLIHLRLALHQCCKLCLQLLDVVCESRCFCSCLINFCTELGHIIHELSTFGFCFGHLLITVCLLSGLLLCLLLELAIMFSMRPLTFAKGSSPFL